MATDDKASPTLDSANDLPFSPGSPSHLTHFKPLTPDQDEPPFKSAYSSFVNLFRFNKDDGRLASSVERAETGQGDQRTLSANWSSAQHTLRAQSLRSHVPYRKQASGERRCSTSLASENRRKEPSLSGHDPRTAVQLRSLSTVLKRLKEIMEGKSQDSDLKQYWMPDSQCKECYDCSEKFTTFRRRHHCRLCGQIFCSRCCNQEIPGKFMGYTGDLRACTYCRKIALSYAHSTDSNSIGEDLSALSDSPSCVSVLDPGEPRTPVGSRKASRNIFLEEDLTWQCLIHPDPSSTTLSTRLGSVQEETGKSPARNRSASVTNLSLDRSGSPMVPSYEASVSPQANRTYVKETNEDERKILLDSVQLKDLWKKICHHNSGMEFQDHRYWLRTHPNCIVGKELVNWLMRNGHITTRAQAIAIGQALVDGRWLDCVSHHDQIFRDEYALYRPLQSTEFSETPSPDSDSVNSVEGHSEPSWFKDIKFDDSDTEQIAEEGDDNLTNSASPSKRTSVSSFQSAMDSDSAASISLNVELDNVNFHIKKHSKYPHVPPHPADQKEYLIADSGGQQMISISDAFIKESLFNRRVEEKSKELFFTPLGWHHNNLDLLREENGEKQAMERLLSANHNHMMALLQQLLYRESLSLSWRDIIVPVVCQVVQTVRPDVKNRDDDMDIRQLVHVKKIPGGKKFDSVVVNGFVCTKNIAHKKMNSCIKNPKILLLKCSIEYLYREETKFTCIDPIVLQEREFLKNYVQRIVDVRPTLVLVEKTVSRIAQDMLLEHGIALVINVKPQVLERVSRMTQGDLVMSMDQLLTKPHLGTCHKFYIQVFQLPNEETKTLMFFEGTPQHLGCTIKLRGAGEYELARVKEILIFMICVAYHSQLEISFLMDEFAMPPMLVKNGSASSLPEAQGEENGQQDLNRESGLVVKDADAASDKLPVISESMYSDEISLLDQRTLREDDGQDICELLEAPLQKRQERLPVDSSYGTPFIAPTLVPEPLLPPQLTDQHLGILDSEQLENLRDLEDFQAPKIQTRVFRDPLQDDTGLYVTEEVTSLEDRLKTFSLAFKQELKNVILCISPVILFSEPFLLTERGMRCPTREYFLEQIYVSPLLSKEYKELDSRRKKQLLRDLSGLQGMNGNIQAKPVQILPSHELVGTRIAEHLNSSQGLARMLADFRARGGRIMQKNADPFAQCKETSVKIGARSDDDERGVIQNESLWSRKVDCLSPANHQRLSVLFSSSSAQSSNAPSACVSPWMVVMEFYGKNDLTLGVFLERYCFRPSYQCPSMFCETPMVHHIRRFVHGQGCVQIILKELDSPVPGYQHTILTYSWCRMCKQVTPVVPLSNDSWSMSFAKYLELRFYGHQYTRRANAEPCGHSIHHDYHQYFSYNQMVASFSYSPIRLLEVCVPHPKIYIKRQVPLKVTVLQDLKDFSQKVSQVYIAVDERLTSLKTDTFSKSREEKMEDLFAQKEMEEVEFRNWIEKIQARMLSSSLDTPQQLQSVSESLIAKKQSLCEMLQAWNNRLQDLFQQEKGRKRPSVPPSPGRLRQGEESKISSMDASPRNVSPAQQNGEKEDRFLTTLSSQSSTSSSLLQLPTPPEVVSDQLTGGTSFANALSEPDTASSSEDVFDGHLLGSTDSQVKEKSTMKAILANLLPGNSYNPIPAPFEPDKHYLMYEHERVPIAVCEKEPSSIIAFALSCKEYRNALDELAKVSLKSSAEEGLQTNSVAEIRAKNSSPVRLPEANVGQSNQVAEAEQPKKPYGVLSFFRGTGGRSPDLSSQKKETLRGADSAYYQVGQTGKEGAENQGAEAQDEGDGSDAQKKQLANPHIELQFSDANAKFYCRIYYAGEFHKMREVILGSSEEDFIRSLSHSLPWQARGGKSGAAFYVTEDDRFILKQMPRLEVQSFLDFAPHYFIYITNAVQQKKPTALAKILGVYRIGYKNSQNNTEKKLDLLVMENLFYGRKMAQVFDLKGSLRNRNVKTDTGKESCDVVLLDENLLKLVRDNPLYIRSHSKAVLKLSIHSDSHFLSSHLIIDYSLLVGRDDTTDELVVGIIDYIRTFTWDKKLEMVVKSTGILGGQGKMPTVVSPELYRTRFCEAMDKYFLMVPDHWTGLSLQC